MDDVVEVIEEDKVESFTDHINSINPSKQFTVEREVGAEGKKHLPVLDVDIIRKEDGSSKFQIYKKKTHTDQYLNWKSHHPLHQKLGVVRTLFDRANSLTTEEEDKKKEMESIKSALRVCGYPEWAFKKVEDMMKGNTKKEKKDPKKKDQEKQRQKLITLPYVEGLSETAARIFKKYHISCAFKPGNTIRQQLFKLKDKADPMKMSDAIYQIECKDCEQMYIGETGRPLQIRIAEHRKEAEEVTRNKKFTRSQRISSLSEDYKSAVAEHAATKNHSLDWDNIKSLGQEPNWRLRGIKEAMEIRSNPCNMNRPQGERHQLPHIWNTLLIPDPGTHTQHHQRGRGRGRARRGAHQ